MSSPLCGMHCPPALAHVPARPGSRAQHSSSTALICALLCRRRASRTARQRSSSSLWTARRLEGPLQGP